MISAKKIQDERIERKWKFYSIQWEASDILSHFFHYGSINLAKRVIATPPSIKVLPLIGIKMYKCSLCENEFAWTANLTRHMSAHTGEKTYNCNQCDFATAWPSNLNKHLKSTLEKGHTNAFTVTLHRLKLEIWGNIWKYTTEKTWTNATNVAMQLFKQAIYRNIFWGNISTQTPGKNWTNVINVTMHLTN